MAEYRHRGTGTALLDKLREIFRNSISQPISGVIDKINPILRGWVKYFARIATVAGPSPSLFWRVIAPR
jgi:hypothetical protein